MLYQNVLSLIGKTPLVKLNYNNLKELNVYAKIEKLNLSGSIKDRPAYQMIKELINQDKLHQGDTIIEPTSGNMGISLACLSNIFKLNCIIVMPKSMSLERRKLISDYHAKIELVDGGMNECKIKALELQKEIKGSVILGQFDNENNVKSHYSTTIKEILEDLPDVDVIISGIGSGGTISGIGKYVKDHHLNIEIIGVEPLNSPLITLKRSGNHKIQGIGANFIPSILDQNVIYKMILISDEDAEKYSRELITNEGLLVGLSSGAVLAGAHKLIKNNEYKHKKIVLIFPDSGERYSW